MAISVTKRDMLAVAVGALIVLAFVFANPSMSVRHIYYKCGSYMCRTDRFSGQQFVSTKRGWINANPN